MMSRLTKMAVSSVAGDFNVAEDFDNWDYDDDWNDMNVAMTGDMSHSDCTDEQL